MKPDFQPSIEPFLSAYHEVNVSTFISSLAAYLEAKTGEFPRIMTAFADPASPIYQHLENVFFDKVSAPPPP